jgi:hypothetical protein
MVVSLVVVRDNEQRMGVGYLTTVRVLTTQQSHFDRLFPISLSAVVTNQVIKLKLYYCPLYTPW